MSLIRIGQGFDVHALAEGNGIILGGVFIDYQASFIAHSDGDVLIHALCDALLGAMARGDIGHHFPDNDASHSNRDSREFLRHVRMIMDSDGYQLGNADLTIIGFTTEALKNIEEFSTGYNDLGNILFVSSNRAKAIN